MLLAMSVIVGSFSAQAAPYGPKGMEIEWKQPGGCRLVLRVFGDELYGRTETSDGYTVAFNHEDGC